MTRTLPRGTRVTGDQRIELAKELAPRYHAGESIRDLAAETGRSYGFIYNVLKEADVKLRGRGGNTRGRKKSS
ncbi:helix-turn-helix domain-containing protein [Actinomadura oligospora]|uniref:helix-turn-helix domain-containing protein n=1 Tax=Actinomadura oligospora TaxID=111804 RepID=UPI0004AE04BB|nr:helix-turn-helix domain-containing protein [Actinomadura oligospora]